MKTSKVLVAVIGLALFCAGCSDKSSVKPGSTRESSAPSESAAPPASRYQSFDQVPGPVLTFDPVTDDTGLKLKVKAMKAEWLPEFNAVPAPAGHHFLVVYVAATPEAKDRGFAGLRLRELNVRYVDPSLPGGSSKSCPFEVGAPVAENKYCYRPSKQLDTESVPLTSDWEHKARWIERRAGMPFAAGEAYASVGMYAVPDSVTGLDTFELCGTGGKPALVGAEPPGPCVKLEVPPRT
ncbi:hypothetical protein [Amycolatopsis sp. NPDC059657]|uniref:hypothetical protein n=1 Tax=Amycolatopsis sp. NPDC059657 TaxID=3346899 RepID=UPI00366FF83F